MTPATFRVVAHPEFAMQTFELVSVRTGAVIASRNADAEEGLRVAAEAQQRGGELDPHALIRDVLGEWTYYPDIGTCEHGRLDNATCEECGRIVYRSGPTTGDD